MSFKCSVFGHAYGDSEIEREREEDGSEVVTTIRETQTCRRCGEMRVVSENKEVTTLETAADIVAGDLEAEEESAGGEDGSEEPPVESVEEVTESVDDAEVIEDSEPADPSPEAPDGPPIQDAEQETAGATEVVGTAAGEETDPETDDGVILDDEEAEETPDREPGEWPDEPDEGDDQWKPETEVDPTPDDDREIEPAGSAVSVPDGEFHCPECEFTTPVAESSLRRGDFCPECHHGALEHVTE